MINSRKIVLPRNVRDKFIPLNNDLTKLRVFLPSLDKNWRKNQRIESKPFQAETLDAVKEFLDRGWNVVGGYEKRASNRKVSNHYVKMMHPDFAVKGENTYATLDISNSCKGSSPLSFDLGVWRQVCANGMVAQTKYSSAKVNHIEADINNLERIINQFDRNAPKVMSEFTQLKEKQLSPSEMLTLANSATELRFGKNHNIDTSQLLNIVREEDRGNDIWSVYNRIQENITQPGMLVDNNGRLINGVTDVAQDIRLNKELFSLVNAYA